ncbi:PAS domain-containing protein [bacterium SCSIO 12844]|nr:PAS domain-containing protein [bacterium SCSIO 12844]
MNHLNFQTNDKIKPYGDEHYLKKELYQLVQDDINVFEFLQNNLLDGLWYWDLERPEHEWMSRGFWELFGYDPETKEHLVNEWHDLIFKEDLEIAVENFNKHCKNEQHAYDQVVRYRHKNGKTIWVRCRGLAIRNAQGKPVRLLGVHTDLTKQKEDEAKIQQYANELEKSNQALEEFAYIVSHDLKQPLRGINNYTDFLMEDYFDQLDEVGKKQLKTLKQLSEHMSELIDKILYFSRVGRVDLSIVQNDLNEVVNEKLFLLENFLEENQAEVKFVKNLPSIKCDAVKIGEVFHNLITNAVKYNDKSPKLVEIDYLETKTHIQFSVKDNGIGIDQKHFDKIFKMFGRLHGQKEYGGGSGAGLSIVKRIVERHNGKVWLESLINQGTVVYFTVNKTYGEQTN